MRSCQPYELVDGLSSNTTVLAYGTAMRLTCSVDGTTFNGDRIAYVLLCDLDENNNMIWRGSENVTSCSGTDTHDYKIILGEVSCNSEAK